LKLSSALEIDSEVDALEASRWIDDPEAQSDKKGHHDPACKRSLNHCLSSARDKSIFYMSTEFPDRLKSPHAGSVDRLARAVSGRGRTANRLMLPALRGGRCQSHIGGPVQSQLAGWRRGSGDFSDAGEFGFNSLAALRRESAAGVEAGQLSRNRILVPVFLPPWNASLDRPLATRMGL
jgi:hypothetical protein